MNMFLEWLSAINFSGGGFCDAAIAEGLAEVLMVWFDFRVNIFIASYGLNSVFMMNRCFLLYMGFKIIKGIVSLLLQVIHIHFLHQFTYHQIILRCNQIALYLMLKQLLNISKRCYHYQWHFSN